MIAEGFPWVGLQLVPLKHANLMGLECLKFAPGKATTDTCDSEILVLVQ